MEYVLFIIIGLVTGLVAGILGIGGGLVVVPALAWIFKHYEGFNLFYMHLAAGTSLAVMIFVSVSNTYACFKQKRVRWDIFTKMIPWIIVSLIVGSVLAGYLRSKILETIFAVIVLIMACKMIFDLIHKKKSKSHISESRATQKISKTTYAIFGSLIGLKSGLLGIGGGAISVPFMSSYGVPIKEATGTSASFTVPISFIGTISFIIMGYFMECHIKYTFGFVYWPAVILIAPFSMLCAPLGAKVSNHMPTLWLRICFIAFLLYTGMNMLFS